MHKSDVFRKIKIQILHFKQPMLRDEHGELPIRFTVAVIVLAALVLLGAAALREFLSGRAEDRLAGELELVGRRADMIYMQGGAGTNDSSGARETVHVSIPHIASYVVFGAMPYNGSPLRNNATDNMYYYVLGDGRMNTLSGSARFASVNGTSEHVTLYPGEYDIILELTKRGSDEYVVMRSYDTE